MKRWIWLLLLCTGCAAFDRECASCSASNFGSDWIVLQYGYDGTPINCWRLTNTAMTNEDRTDGIYWQSPDGHLVHISGWYNRAQVQHGDFAGAAEQLGIDLKRCSQGRYRPAGEVTVPESVPRTSATPAWTYPFPPPPAPSR